MHTAAYIDLQNRHGRARDVTEVATLVNKVLRAKLLLFVSFLPQLAPFGRSVLWIAC